MADGRNDTTIDLNRSRADHAPDSDSIVPLAVGQVLRNRYVLEARLGTGGKGTVFKALDRLRTALPDGHQYVALKILHSGGDCPEQTLAKLRLEFNCAQILSDPHIVNVYELDRDGDVVFFTMELLEGETLSAVIERLRPAAMSRSQAWQLIRQLGAGLAHAHERGVVHGDLKPKNIYITREGELRILDFGAARSFIGWRSEHADHATPSGTPAYASCEQLEGRRADPRDDLYALACICYELLAGEHPFDSRSATLARDYHVSVTRPEGLTGRQWRTLQKGLSWHRAARSIGVHAWMNRLLAEKEQEHPATPLQQLAPSKPVPSRSPWRAAAVFLVASLAAAAVLAQLRSSAGLKAVEATAPVQPQAASAQATSPPLGESPAVDLTAAPASVPAEQPSSDKVSPDKGTADEPSQPRPPKAVSTVISVEPSQVRADDHFAEIRLHRNLLQKGSSFTWWTEPATAKADVDYVPETVAIQAFPSGYQTTHLYVRLLPHSLRSHRSYFYIAIAETRPHRASATVIRRQIWLPMTSDLQAHR